MVLGLPVVSQAKLLKLTINHELMINHSKFVTINNILIVKFSTKITSLRMPYKVDTMKRI